MAPEHSNPGEGLHAIIVEALSRVSYTWRHNSWSWFHLHLIFDVVDGNGECPDVRGARDSG